MFSGDSLSYHKDEAFSTKDADHDSDSVSCSFRYHGAWWFRNCYYSHLNGRYYQRNESCLMDRGIWWNTWMGPLKSVTMKMRSATFPGQQYHESILK